MASVLSGIFPVFFLLTPRRGVFRFFFPCVNLLNIFRVCDVMHEASASAKDAGRVGNPPSSSHNPLLYASTLNNIPDKPISISFSAKQFEHFERAIQQVNVTTSSMSDNCVITNTMSLSNVSLCSIATSHSRSFRPSLINIIVQDFSDSNIPMDVDIESKNASRKRALPLTTSKIQGNTKAKKLQMT